MATSFKQFFRISQPSSSLFLKQSDVRESSFLGDPFKLVKLERKGK
jgi:hypothetical protein